MLLSLLVPSFSFPNAQYFVLCVTFTLINFHLFLFSKITKALSFLWVLFELYPWVIIGHSFVVAIS